jgi:hypothetical protein
MGKIAGAVGLGDVLGLGAADIAATDVGAFAAADAADLAAASAPELTAAAAPDLTAAAGLDAANATFGTFSPELFAANTAATEIAPAGFDLGAGAVTDLGALGPAADIGSFGPAIDTSAITGADMGGGLAGSTTGVGGDVFSGATAEAGPTAGESGTFGPSATAASGQGAGESVSGGIPATQDIVGQEFSQLPQGPMVSSGEGIVQSEPITPTAVQAQPTTLENAFPGSSQAITGGLPSNAISTQAMQNVGIVPTPENPFGGTPATLDISTLPSDTKVAAAFPQAAAPLAAPTEVGPGVVGPAAGPATATTAAPTATAATAATPAATTAAAPTAAGGGIDALTGLRAGTAGINAIAAGINLSNALNQPSYQAFLPSSYPGSPYLQGPNQPGYQGTGYGGRGGLAANRLTNDLVSGASPQQLAATGIISPQRATQLQQDYNGISAAYAKQLGVSPANLSTAVRQIIAARALGEAGLGGA